MGLKECNNGTFVRRLFRECLDTLLSKRHDYANRENPFVNFETSAQFAGVSVDQVFLNMIAIKVTRLRQLMGGKKPKNESFDDTIKDLINYFALWREYRYYKNTVKK